ncbi:thiazolylpeptide-type bacteriocin [Kitasatospora sp. NBC_01287]|uniref:thiazolylpeptide-type bacteriocin n=1 Tax=Kitasatospora sp. NBC_01287 TaxID=2903573 RepID=UPI002255C98E|nr:thiazolylpeptide-type bacteriocin [Kitasatospora sp. NBC_01287]MCX4745872.1 thiazolylpeptide-type bacteriocin [Kitasatospora sp. NBC_01287]
MSDQPTTPTAPGLVLTDLDLGELSVTVLRDSVALPETGASAGPSSSSCGSSSCVTPAPYPPHRSF